MIHVHVYQKDLNYNQCLIKLAGVSFKDYDETIYIR